jgi:hypothetical protein
MRWRKSRRCADWIRSESASGEQRHAYASGMAIGLLQCQVQFLSVYPNTVLSKLHDRKLVEHPNGQKAIIMKKLIVCKIAGCA